MMLIYSLWLKMLLEICSFILSIAFHSIKCGYRIVLNSRYQKQI